MRTVTFSKFLNIENKSKVSFKIINEDFVLFLFFEKVTKQTIKKFLDFAE